MSGPYDWEQADKAIAAELKAKEHTIVLDDGQILTEALQSEDGNWWVGDSEYDSEQVIATLSAEDAAAGITIDSEGRRFIDVTPDPLFLTAVNIADELLARRATEKMTDGELYLFVFGLLVTNKDRIAKSSHITPFFRGVDAE